MVKSVIWKQLLHLLIMVTAGVVIDMLFLSVVGVESERDSNA